MKTEKIYSIQEQIRLIIAYVLSFYALIPIIRYLLIYKLDVLPQWNDNYVLARIFFSGPILITIGIYLAIRYKKSVHGKLGVMLTVLGIIWLVAIGVTIYNEAA
jgi:hypothetical protein